MQLIWNLCYIWIEYFPTVYTSFSSIKLTVVPVEHWERVCQKSCFTVGSELTQHESVDGSVHKISHLSHASMPVSITLKLRGHVDRGTFCELCEFATSRKGVKRVKNEQKRQSIFKTRQIRSNLDQKKSRRHVEQSFRNACEKAAWDLLL